MIAGDNPLQWLIDPRSVAMFGSGVIARGLLGNIQGGSLADRLCLIGGSREDIAGATWYATLEDVPGPVTLTLIATSDGDVPEAFRACQRKGVRAAIVYPAGSVADDARQAPLSDLCAEAARRGLRVMGPNALGVILPHAGINLTPIVGTVPPGNLALVSQSLAVCANILDWNHNNEFGFSAIFGPGASADLELPEILDYLASDLKTGSILLYLEGVHDSRRFLSAVRAAAAVKPVIAVKSGQHPVSSRAAAAHSGANVDRDDALAAALRRAGVLRVDSLGEMFSAARALTTPRKPRGNRLAIVANGGGPAVIALDCAAKLNIETARLGPLTLERLRLLAPALWSSDNPVDVGFAATSEHFVSAVIACADDPEVDGVLAIFTPNAVADPLAVAVATIDALKDAAKPVLACLLGEQRTGEARAVYAKARFPVFRTPENAVTAFAFMVNWVRNQALLLETPPALSSYREPNIDLARALVESPLARDRGEMELPDVISVLAAFHVPVVPTELAATPTEAVAVANRMGYPVTLRSVLPGRAIHQKLRSAAEVAMAFRDLVATRKEVAGAYVEHHVDKPQGRRLRVSIRQDSVFGPVISLSEAGIAPEIYEASSIALPPLNPRLVDEMLGVPHIARLLGPLRRMPAVAKTPLRDLLLRVSELASELPWMRSFDITVIADDIDAVVVDAHINVRPLPAGRERYDHMAIYPYPAQLVGSWQLKDGRSCVIRPIRPGDALLLQDFVRSLSDSSRYFRFFSTMRELPRSSLARYTQLDFSRELMLVVVGEREGRQILLGEANYSILPGGKDCEFAVIVADDLAGKGAGSRLMRCLMDAARKHGLTRISGQVLANNEPMLALMEALDFVVRLTDDRDVVEVSRSL